MANHERTGMPNLMCVGFLYNAQDHHVLHSLPIACELSRISDVAVTILARTQDQLEFARRLSLLYPDNRLNFELLRSAPFLRFRGVSKWAKRSSLLINRRRLNSFDALVLPERTSLQLKKIGVIRPRYIHSFHGSSGHDRVTDPRLREFDLLLAPSARRLDRIAVATAEPPGCSTVIGYVKFDLVRRMGQSRGPLFRNNRPTVLYNPHHWADKSSWPMLGLEILRHFKNSADFNLIFAPHVRLFDPPARHEADFREFSGFEHLLIDLGSERSVDMSYTLAADVYLGDVSSQVFEFAARPRPCIFLNPHAVAWENDENFASWRLGRVVTDMRELDDALATIPQWQPNYERLQRKFATANFPELGTPAPLRGARAIAAFLRQGGLKPGWDDEDQTQASAVRRAPGNDQ